MDHIFYNRWEDLAHPLIVGVLAYVFLIGHLNRVAAVVLETDGSSSVVHQSDQDEGGQNALHADSQIVAPKSSLSDVRQVSSGQARIDPLSEVFD